MPSVIADLIKLSLVAIGAYILCTCIKEWWRKRWEREILTNITVLNSWKRCPICQQYYFTTKLACMLHDEPVLLLSITEHQRMRLVSTLYDDVLEPVLNSEKKRHAFGAFFLKLEEITEKQWMPELAYALYQAYGKIEDMEEFLQFIDQLETMTARKWSPEDAVDARYALQSPEEIQDFVRFVNELERGTNAKCINKSILEYYLNHHAKGNILETTAL